jgi:hypothetical protein
MACAPPNVVHKKFLPLLLLIGIALDFSGCAYTTAQGRREIAYRRYVQKSIKQRRRAMARAQKAANRQLKLKTKSIQPSDPRVTTAVEDYSSPSVSQMPAEVEPAPAFREPVVDPITVSASATSATDADSAPQQP